MRSLGDFREVYVHVAPIDFRIRRIGLASYIQNVTQRSFFDGALFVFRNRNKSSLRIVYWDRTGTAMWEKQLEKEKFPWPSDERGDYVSVTSDELEMLLEGIDFSKIRRHKTLTFSHV